INNNDEEAMKRIINYPLRGIGDSSVDKIILAANENDKSLWYVMEHLGEFNTGLNNGVQSKISDFVTMIKSFSVQLKNENAFDLGNRIAKSSGILAELYNDKSPEGISRHENISELLNGLKEFSENPNAAFIDIPDLTP